MFSRASVRKSSLSLHHFVSIQQRPFFSKSHASASALSSLRESGHGDNGNGNGLLSRSLSGIVVVGSTLGLWLWSSPENNNPFLSLADSSQQNSWTSHIPGQSEDSKSAKKPKFLFRDSYRKKVFFKYEKRIRMQSSPEKVFEYFASVRKGKGEIFMTPADLMRAVVPVFPPSESDRVREGYLNGERNPGELYCAPSKFFMLFDTDGDGLISFPEYIFFVTLLSIPESSFTVAFKLFDLDNNDEIDREEFKKVMYVMRSRNRQGAHHKDGLRFRMKAAEPVEDGSLVEYFFGKDGNDNLKHARFVQFLKDLHNEILRLEFAHYDYNLRGTISAEDFALSLVAAADISDINKFLDRVDELKKQPALLEIRITYEEFKEFAELRKKLQPLSLAIFGYGKVNGLLTKKDFQRAAARVCGVTISDNVVDVVFHLFDTNGDGTLSSKEFIEVLQGRELDSLQTREPGLKGLLSCWRNCTTNCSLELLL